MEQVKVYSKKWAAVLLFVFSPVLSFQETAAPGSTYVVFCLLTAFLVFFATRNKMLQLTHISAILMWCFAVFSTLINGVTIDMHCIKYFLLIIIYIFLTFSETGRTDMRKIFSGYNCLSVILAILIILSFVAGVPHVESYINASRYSIGITGLYKNPNYLVSFMLVTLYFYVYRIFYDKQSSKSWMVSALISVFILYAIFLTGTRAGLLCAGVILCYCIGGKFLTNFKKGVASIVAIAFLCLIIILLLGSVGGPVISAYFQRDFFSDSLRISIWLAALEKYASGSLIFGGGINTINEYLIESGYTYTHNIFLEMLCEQGIIAFLFFPIILFSGIQQINKKDKFFYLGFLIVTSIPLFFQNGFTEVNFWRYLLLNRLVLNYSICNQSGFVEEIIHRKIYHRKTIMKYESCFSYNEHI